MKKLLIAVLGTLLFPLFAGASPWDDELTQMLQPAPYDQTIVVQKYSDEGFYEVNLDPWFLREDNVSWVKHQIEKARRFELLTEREVKTYLPLGAEQLDRGNTFYTKYAFQNEEYIFYFNGNKHITAYDPRADEKVSFFFKTLEKKVQIWGKETRVVISPAEALLIIPNGMVYEFNPEKGLDTIKNRGAIFVPDVSKESMEALSYAKTQVGTSRALSAGGKTFNNDCSGFVSAVFMKYGIDLTEGIENVKNRTGYNLTAIIFDAQDYNQRLHGATMPSPGDLVFFSNTYDRNKNGQWDDYLSHIGIVEEVDQDGTITFIHHLNVDLGVRRDHMNLLRPDDPEVNSVIRQKKQSDPIHFRYLAGQLYESFARYKPSD